MFFSVRRLRIMQKAVKLILNPFFQMLFLGVLCFLFYNQIGDWGVRFSLTISVFLREVLFFVLPFLIFSFVSVALSEIRGTVMILSLMGLIFLSSFFHAFLSGIIGYSLLSESANHVKNFKTIAEISPLLDFNFIKVADNTTSLIAGILVGIANSRLKNKYIDQTINFIHHLVLNFMNKFFVRLLPLFTTGFLLKLLREDQMSDMGNISTHTFVKLILFLILHFGFWLFAAAKFQRKSALQILKNISPALAVAFTTISSAAAFPFSLKAATANTGDRKLVDTVMPLTLSFHLAGDILLVLIICMIVAVTFNHPLPDFYSFFTLTLFFIFNQFAGAGVPNATIMVLIPMLKSSWGFDDSMCAFTIAFYSLIEPISTVGNVTANNLFVILFKNLLDHFEQKHTQHVDGTFA